MTEHNQAALMLFEGNILAALNDKLLTELKLEFSLLDYANELQRSMSAESEYSQMALKNV